MLNRNHVKCRMSISPFDFLTSITSSKKNLIVDDVSEKQYNAFMVNRGLSYFSDTVHYANLMNQYHGLSKKAQYSFLMNSVSKRRRFSKWHKASESEDLTAVKAYFNYNDEKARQALLVLTREQIDTIRDLMYRGGRKPPKKRKT